MFNIIASELLFVLALFLTFDLPFRPATREELS
jgi:hypothetical protein